VVDETMAAINHREDTDIETILEADRLARIKSAEVVQEMTKQAIGSD
jgi:hypothetical protein